MCTVVAVTLLPRLCSVLFKSSPPFEKKRVMVAGSKTTRFSTLTPHQTNIHQTDKHQTNMMFNYTMNEKFHIFALCTVAAVTLLPRLCSVLFKSSPPFEKKRVMIAGSKKIRNL